MSVDDRAERGARLRGRAQGAKTDKLHGALIDLDPKVARWANEFIFGDVWDSPDLDFHGQMMVAVVALAATGRTGQLRNYLHGAVQEGMAPEQLREALRMLVVYCGFPVALDALNELDKVLSTRGADR